MRAAIATAALCLLLLASASVPAQAKAGTPQEPAATPTPTLGSTASPKADPPGAGDPDANDFNKAPLVVIAVLVVAAVVAGGTFYLVRSRRIDLSQLSEPDDASAHRDDGK
ncbi:hypothetical protein [Kribbella sp. NPDC004875]|uniref:hypothetical protein n=1 Tax=Kribbella sp. NPDC004875 TaxID=3364107 RepID=UPI0036B7D3CA